MRIALLTPFYPYRGGIAQFSDRFYQELVKENEVEVFSFYNLYPKILFPGTSQLVLDPKADTSLPSKRLLSSTNPFSYKKTAKSINSFNPDVLIIAYWMPYMAVAYSGVCKRLNKNIKIVGLVHNARPHEKSFFNNYLVNLFFRYCHGFITMSEVVTNVIKEIDPSANILSLEHPIYDHYPNKIDREEAIEKLQIDEGKKTLLFFGLIRSYKGLDLLIESMGLLDDSYQLVIGGECYNTFSSYQQLIDLSKNSKNIKVFEKYIPDEMVSVFFSAADVLILPYRSATQSGVVATAYQLELPVIVTDVGSLGAVVRNSGTGVVASEVSAKGLSKAIKQYFGSEDKMVLLENVRKEKARLSWSSFAKLVKPFISIL